MRMNPESGVAKSKLLAVVAIGGAAVLGAVYNHHQTGPAHAFEAKYTQDDQCLDNTPYDLDMGAVTNVVHGPKADVLEVVPLGANNYNPSVLNFTFRTHTVMKKAELFPADHQTASLISKKHCPDAPTGL